MYQSDSYNQTASNYRLIERSTYTSVTRKEEITKTVGPIDCDSDYHSDNQVPIEDSSTRDPFQPETEVLSNSPEAEAFPVPTTWTISPLYKAMKRVQSSADISAYECNDGATTLQSLSSLILLIASLIMIGIGSVLMGFYRLHMLDSVSVWFLVVPLLLVLGGVFAFLTAILGFYATSKEESCLMITHACFMAIEFVILVCGIIASVHLIFFIQTGLFNANVIPELNLYQESSYVRYKWDTLQREFTCCGGFGYSQGYQDWKHTEIGMRMNSVPDSCCINEGPSCGVGIFVVTDAKKLFQSMFPHGCITIMQRRLEDHVVYVLMAYAVVGGILAVIQLLSIVLACCYANQISKDEEMAGVEQRWQDYEYERASSRPPTPSTPRARSQMRERDNNETTF